MKNNLKKLREGAGASIGCLAQRCNMAKSAIHGIENGATPRLDSAYAIAGALNATVYEVFPDETEFEETNELKQVKK